MNLLNSMNPTKADAISEAENTRYDAWFLMFHKWLQGSIVLKVWPCTFLHLCFGWKFADFHVSTCLQYKRSKEMALEDPASVVEMASKKVSWQSCCNILACRIFRDTFIDYLLCFQDWNCPPLKICWFLILGGFPRSQLLFDQLPA